jgi:hypothetical protein
VLGEELSVKVSFHDSVLSEEGDGIIRVYVATDCICDAAGDVEEWKAIRWDGVGNRFEVGWGEAGRASPRALTGGEKREQTSRTGSDRCLGKGGVKFSHFVS